MVSTIKFTISVDDLREIVDLPRKMEMNIFPKMIKRATDLGLQKARDLVTRFTFEGELLNSLVSRNYKNYGMVAVVGNARLMNEAVLNEFGPQAGVHRHGIVYRSQATPKLQRWMDMVGRKSIRLGGANTKWGTRNVFLAPAWEFVIMHTPEIMQQEMEKLR